MIIIYLHSSLSTYTLWPKWPSDALSSLHPFCLIFKGAIYQSVPIFCPYVCAHMPMFHFLPLPQSLSCDFAALLGGQPASPGFFHICCHYTMTHFSLNNLHVIHERKRVRQSERLGHARGQKKGIAFAICRQMLCRQSFGACAPRRVTHPS